MKIIKIDNTNVQGFAEIMVKFNRAHRYNSDCYSMSDIRRERCAFALSNMIIEELDKVGFDIQVLNAFIENKWRIDDLVSPNVEKPVLFVTSHMYENYLDNENITDYYVETADGEIFTLPA